MSTEQRRWILCGGLASGKSAVRKLLAASGVATIDADTIGHEVLESNREVIDQVSERWPGAVAHGEVDRRALAAVVFEEAAELAQLEAITHPHIFGTIASRVEQTEGSVVVEIPLLTDRLGDGWRRLVVDCRDALRLERAVRRGMSQADAQARMAAQPSRAEWLAAADLVVPNHLTEDDLALSVERLVPTL